MTESITPPPPTNRWPLSTTVSCKVLGQGEADDRIYHTSPLPTHPLPTIAVTVRTTFGFIHSCVV